MTNYIARPNEHSMQKHVGDEAKQVSLALQRARWRELLISDVIRCLRSSLHDQLLLICIVDKRYTN